ncbi:MAG: hypothetical protein JST73_06360, partial [Actinobacteria bacterium]|nr:hypothetical protein [Actinomycetota bacterium]
MSKHLRKSQSIFARKLWAVATVVMLLAAALIARATVHAPHADAAGNLSCAAGVIYAQDAGGNLVQVNLNGVANGGAAVTSTVTNFGAGSAWNLLGVTAQGTQAWASLRSGTNNTTITPGYYTASTGTYTSLGFSFTPTSTTNLGSWVAGANDLSNGDYYVGIPKTAGTGAGMQIYKLNAAKTGFTFVGYIATANPASFTNGDFAFDNQGNFYLVSSSGTQAQVYVATAAAVRGASGGQIAATAVGSVLAVGAAVNGIAFDQNGTLILGTSTALQRFDPSTGTIVANYTMAGINSSDLGSCSSPSTISVKKNVTQRVDPSDQFALTLKDSTNATVASATTAGSATGEQPQVAGPVFTSAGKTYTFSEAMAAGSASVLGAYGSSWSCVDTSTTPATSIGTGTGTSGSVTIPDNGVGNAVATVSCTFTNAPSTPPSISLTKSNDVVGALGVNGVAHYTFVVKNTGGTYLKGVTLSDSIANMTGLNPSASALAAMVLAPNASVTVTGASYTTTQGDVNAGSVVNNAGVSGTPSDSTGTATGQPNVTASASSTYNTQGTPSISLTKSNDVASTLAAGGVAHYTFVVTNNGTQPLTGITLSDSIANMTGLTPSA